MKKANNLLLYTSLGFLLLSSLLFLNSCKKESNVVPDGTSLGTDSIQLNTFAATTTVSSQGYNIENSLPKGYVKNGSVDYTSYLQTAINKYSNITFPAFPIMVNDKGLTIGSNKTITFLKGSELQLKPTSKGSYVILNIRDATNVVLKDPYITGDLKKHLGTTGEYGIGIGLYSSSNVTITGAKVYDCWGDGIYIGVYKTGVCKNIRITDAYLRNNRRDGISIIAVDGLKLENPYAGYSNGTKPMTGINIEPNSNSNEVKNVTITNPTTEHNGAFGIMLSLSRIMGDKSKKVDVTVTNHNDNSSNAAFKLSCIKSDRGGKITGEVNVLNPVWRKNADRPLVMYVTEKGLKNNIKSPIVYDLDNKILSTSKMEALIKKGVRDGIFSIL